MKPTIALIGPGRVGCAITKKLSAAGYQLTAVISRNHQRAVSACEFIGCSTDLATEHLAAAASADIVIIAVPDDHIHSVTQQLQRSCEPLNEIPALVHFSGLHPAAIMSSGSSCNTTLLSLHPLFPFATRERAYQALNQCPCAIESPDSRGMTLGRELVAAFSGVPFTIDADKKVLYHAAACISSNYLVTLMAVARDLLVQCGIEKDRAIPLLQPLAHASLNNVENLGPELGLTGPISRGDTRTVAEHLQAIEKESPEVLSLYRVMGIHTAQLAADSTRLNQQHADFLREQLSAENLDTIATRGT